MNPKISIVIPCYKVEKYLNRCIESVVNQSLTDIEIILVDDLSPDNTPSLCDEWSQKDSRISVIHKNVNEGLGYARNTGLKKASGDYVAFIDSDDWIDSDMMEKLYNECIKEDLDAIFSEFNVDEYPRFNIIQRPEKIYYGNNQIEKLRLDIVGAEPEYKSGVKFQCSACKGLYRKKLIDDYGIFFFSEREYICEDMIFNLEFLSHATKIKTVPWQFYHYCLNNQSLSHTYRQDRWDKLVYMLKVLNNPAKFNDKIELKLRLARTAIFYTMSGISNEMKRENFPYRKKLENVSNITSNPYLKSLIDKYPFSRLPIKWKIYYIALKYKLNGILYMLVKL